MSLLVQGFIGLGVATLLELTLFIPMVWSWRGKLAPAVLLLIAFSSGLIISTEAHPLLIILAILNAYRVVNVLRIPEQRMHEVYLRSAFRSTSLSLMVMQLICCGVWLLWQHPAADTTLTWLVLVIAQVIFAVMILGFTLHNILRHRPRLSTKHYSKDELPTVTIAVPARNETEDLTECLESLVANDYPKLEILVLDDCSRDRTPDIIRSFAHDGVRFVNGETPDSHWLAKNLAYDKLYKEASGDLVLFCGVDTRFKPHAIYNMVEIMLSHDLDMISMLPLRARFQVLAQIVQPMRYWWEIAFPRKWMKQPPCLSTCWLTTQRSLKRLGGFEGISRDIRPECFYARELHRDHRYAFMIANKDIGIQTLKAPREQFHTAIRTRYPEVHKKPERVFILSLVEAMFFCMPFASLTYGLLTGYLLVAYLAVIAIVALVLTHIIIVGISSPKSTWLAALNFPLVALAEIALLNESMRRYEFDNVEWKGRNICTPVMHVYPSLPPIE